MRLQFWPKNYFYGNAVQHTGKFDLKFKVQSRQLCGSHVDSHYCAALFRYVKSFAVKYRDYTVIVCMDDTNQICIGETCYPTCCCQQKKTKLWLAKMLSFQQVIMT